MVGDIITFACIFLAGCIVIDAQCLNHCNQHGTCDVWAKCNCFTGWEGSECSFRTCPTGVVTFDIASDTDKAHAQGICSGHGTCDTNKGSCSCFDGYSGANCGQSVCMNDCSGKGKCINLYTAAREYNGFTLNHTTTYDQWDALITYGCVCDLGFSGYDCSQKNCDYGNDPRDTIYSNETVSIVCDCTDPGTCAGKFRFRFMGLVTTSWLYPYSTEDELADVLMSTTLKYRGANAYTFTSITADAVGYTTICNDGFKTTTNVMFNRFVGDVPALSIYQNKLTTGTLYFQVMIHIFLLLLLLIFLKYLYLTVSYLRYLFQTDQTLTCDCDLAECMSTFQLVFDGEIGATLKPLTSTISDLVDTLAEMNTLKSASVFINNVTVGTEVAGVDAPICAIGVVKTHVISLTGPIGNLPRIRLLSSVNTDNSILGTISSDGFDYVLAISSNDGRDDNVKECNGAGACNYDTG
jgi:hypothetical protein